LRFSEQSLHTASAYILGNRLILVDLNLDPTLRSELGDDDGVGDFPEDLRISLASQAVVESMQIGSGNDVLQMNGLKRYIRMSKGSCVQITELTSLELKVNGSGARFGPLQNG
jgi:hypothetical protein